LLIKLWIFISGPGSAAEAATQGCWLIPLRRAEITAQGKGRDAATTVNYHEPK